MAGKARVVSFDRPALGFSPPARDGSVGLGWAGGETRKDMNGETRKRMSGETRKRMQAHER